MESVNQDAVFYIWFGSLFIWILFWFSMVSRFFSYMSKNHAQVYSGLGSPALFSNNTPKNNIAFLSFILKGKYKVLKDANLSKRCNIMKLFFYAYLVYFLGPFILMAAHGNS